LKNVDENEADTKAASNVDIDAKGMKISKAIYGILNSPKQRPK
jgi:hypothetical protein